MQAENRSQPGTLPPAPPCGTIPLLDFIPEIVGKGVTRRQKPGKPVQQLLYLTEPISASRAIRNAIGNLSLWAGACEHDRETHRNRCTTPSGSAAVTGHSQVHAREIANYKLLNYKCLVMRRRNIIIWLSRSWSCSRSSPPSFCCAAALRPRPPACCLPPTPTSTLTCNRCAPPACSRMSSSPDPDYAQFVADTGFQFERDLDEAAFAVHLPSAVDLANSKHSRRRPATRRSLSAVSMTPSSPPICARRRRPAGPTARPSSTRSRCPAERSASPCSARAWWRRRTPTANS